MRTSIRLQVLEAQLFEQRQWVGLCEKNGLVYAGERGPAIRKKAYEDLHRLEDLVQREARK